MPILVDDAADPRLVDYVGLTDPALRRRVEPAAGLYIAEGELVVRRAVAAGHRLRSLLVENRYVDLLTDVVEFTVPVYVGSRNVLEEVTGFNVHRGVLASVERPSPLDPVAVVTASARLLILEDLSNPTNLGAVFRCAAALGIDALLLSPRCADPLYRRSVRVSMGAVFAVPYARLTPWPDGLAAVRAAGVRLLALTPDSAAVPLDRLDVDDVSRVALLLGAEGPGLTAGVLEAADQQVRIPMAHGVDSLNVAAAAAIACFLVGSTTTPQPPW